MFEDIILLKALAMNYPIIQSMDLIFPKTITVITPSGTAGKVKNILKNFPECRATMANSDFQFVFCTNAKKINIKAAQIREELLNGIQVTRGLPIIITETLAVDELSDDQFIIFIDEDLVEYQFENSLLYPDEKRLPSIMKQVSNYKKIITSEEKICLQIAKDFVPETAMAFLDEKKLSDMIKILCERDEEARSENHFLEIFTKILYSWQGMKGFCNVCSLKEARVFQRDTYIFYDDEFLYLSSKLFREIVSPITKSVALTTLKAGLVKDGVLIPEKKSSNFTVKVTCKDEKNIPVRIRMLRLKQEKLNRMGMLSFIHLCILEKEGYNV